MHQGSDSILDSPGQGTDSLPVTPKSSKCILYNNHNNNIFSMDIQKKFKVLLTIGIFLNNACYPFNRVTSGTIN